MFVVLQSRRLLHPHKLLRPRRHWGIRKFLQRVRGRTARRDTYMSRYNRGDEDSWKIDRWVRYCSPLYPSSPPPPALPSSEPRLSPL